MSKLLERVAAASGVLSVVLAIVGYEFIAGGGSGGPGPNATASEIGAHLVNNPPTSRTWMGAYVALLGDALFILFAAYLANVLRRAEGEDGWLWSVALGGGLLSVVIKVGSAAPAYAAMSRANQRIDAQVATALVDINGISFGLMWLMVGVMLLATAAVVIRTAVLPRWLGWTALLVGIASVAQVGLMFTFPGFAPAIPLYYLWSIAAAVVLVRHVGRSQPGVHAHSVATPSSSM